MFLIMKQTPATTRSFPRRMMASIAMCVLVLAVAPAVGDAFVNPSLVWTTTASKSPTQVGLVMNFFNDGKKALVKSLAGDYDAVSIRARIDGLVADNPVLMFSFTT
jgi:hypothetical protein